MHYFQGSREHRPSPPGGPQLQVRLQFFSQRESYKGMMERTTKLAPIEVAAEFPHLLV